MVGMGLPDAYPFVLPPPAIEKLRFVHETICGAVHDAGVAEAASVAAAASDNVVPHDGVTDGSRAVASSEGVAG